MFFIMLFGMSLGFGFLNRWLLINANNKIWDKKLLKTSAKFLPYMALFFSVFWGLGIITKFGFISTFGATATSISLVLNALLLLSLPISLWINSLIKAF